MRRLWLAVWHVLHCRLRSLGGATSHMKPSTIGVADKGHRHAPAGGCTCDPTERLRSAQASHVKRRVSVFATAHLLVG